MSNCYLYHLVRRFRGAIRFARTSTATNEAGAMQQVQITHNPFEALDTYRFQLYGFASAMPVGTDVVADGTSLDGHVHGDVMNGAGDTGPPVMLA